MGGVTAVYIDLTDLIQARLLPFIGGVILGAFLLLMMVFRSLFVPFKAAVMNLLSIGAAYGFVVAVFQWGWGKDLIGLAADGAHRGVRAGDDVRHPLRPVDGLRGLPAQPHQEDYDRTGDSHASVVNGLASTARVITSAALIMISVFLAFVTNPSPTVKMIGLGMAVAVFVDASIVRMMLVPATMELAGRWNWWIPALARPGAPPHQRRPARARRRSGHRAGATTPSRWAPAAERPAEAQPSRVSPSAGPRSRWRPGRSPA